MCMPTYHNRESIRRAGLITTEQVDSDEMTDAEKVALYERYLFRIYGNHEIEIAKQALQLTGVWEEDDLE